MNSILRASVLVLVLCAILNAPAFAESDRDDPGTDAQRIAFVRGYLSGVWLITLNLPPEDAAVCPGNQLLPETSSVLGNFTRSGEFLSTSDLPPLQVPAIDQSTGLPLLDENGEPIILSIEVGFGHGLWQRTPRGRFILESWRLAKLNGQAVGLAKGESIVDLDRSGRLMTGDIRLVLTLADGTVLPPACGTIEGAQLNE